MQRQGWATALGLADVMAPNHPLNLRLHPWGAQPPCDHIFETFVYAAVSKHKPEIAGRPAACVDNATAPEAWVFTHALRWARSFFASYPDLPAFW